MNRRGFFRGMLACALTAAARVYTPSVLTAAQVAPVPKPIQHGLQCCVTEHGARCSSRATSRVWEAPKDHPYDEVWVCAHHACDLMTNESVSVDLDAADALRVLTRASNEIYRLAPKVIQVTPLNLP